MTSVYRSQTNGCKVVDESSSFASYFEGSLSLPQSRLFGTDGIRGKVGTLLSAPLAMHIGYWTARVLEQSASQSGVAIVGQDSRNSSDMLAAAVISGLTSAGMEVWNLGLCPTPCVAYLTGITEAVGGIVISASHNPPEDNGIKIFGRDGLKLPVSQTDKIEAGLRGKIISKEELISPASVTDSQIKIVPRTMSWGKCDYRPYLIEDYTRFLLEGLPGGIDFAGMKILLDLAWGAAARIAPSVFRALGAEVICLHDLPNGDRINVNCGSTHLEVLQQAMQKYKADLGFAFDGDADRALAVDGKGRIVNGDYLLYFWGKSLKQEGKLPQNLIVATVMANLSFEKAWLAEGGKLIRTAVGDRHVQEEMWRTKAMLGGEQSGHIICHHYGNSGDGIQTALHLTALVRRSGTTLAELMDSSFQNYPQLLHNVRIEDRERRLSWQECEQLQNAIASAEDALQNCGRVLVRASGTEPVIRVMVEAADMKLVRYWTEKLVRVIEENLI